MPGMYHGEDMMWAGFCVGVVENQKSSTLPAAEGDVLIAPSGFSGPHRMRDIRWCGKITRHGCDPQTNLLEGSRYDHLLEPTLYLRKILILELI